MRLRPSVIAAAILLATPAGALAQHPAVDEQFREGREAMKSGDYKRALTLLRESQAREPGKGKLLNIALCEEQLGMLGSALRHLQEIAPQFPPSDERTPILKQRLAALEPKAPRLRVTLAPDAPAGTTVTVDGEALPAASLGAEVPVDPGKHVVTATAPGAAAREQKVELAAGEHKALLAAPGAAASEPVDKPATDKPADKPGRPIGWTVGVAAVGVGGAAIVAGIGTGIAFLGKRSTLARACGKDGACPPSQQAAVDSYHALGAASTGTFVAGALLAAGGAALMIVAPGKKPAESAWIVPEIGPGSIGVRGRF